MPLPDADIDLGYAKLTSTGLVFTREVSADEFMFVADVIASTPHKGSRWMIGDWLVFCELPSRLRPTQSETQEGGTDAN